MRRDTRAYIDRESGELSVDYVALARMNAHPNAEAEVADRVTNRAAAADRSCRPVKARGEEAIACGVDLAAAVTGELASNHGVVFAQDLVPTWPQLDRFLRRSDEIGEEDGRQYALGFEAGLLTVGPDSRQELVESGQHHEPSVARRDVDQLCTGNPLSHVRGD